MNKLNLFLLLSIYYFIDATSNESYITIKVPLSELAQVVQKEEKNDNEEKQSSSQKGLQEGWTRATFILKEDLLEKLKALSYWNRKTMKETLEDALVQYFKDKKIELIREQK